MQRFALGCCAIVLVGCTKPKEEPAVDTTAAAPAAPMVPAPVALADIAGKWTVRVMPETGDSTLVTYEMVAAADASGWSLNFPKRKPTPMRVIAVAGDSIVTEAGPFESLLRKRVQVRIVNVARLKDGKLVGTTTARYETKGADSVARLRFEGTRKP